jgi:hypothetical protein
MKQEMIDRLYLLVEEVYESKKESMDGWEWWPKLLTAHGLIYHVYETRAEIVDALVGALNQHLDVVAIGDPQCLDENTGHDGVLLVPRDLAEKIVVLGGLPCL